MDVHAHSAVPIPVLVRATSDTSLQISLSVITEVMNQHTGGDTYTVDVSPDCRNGQNSGVENPAPQSLAYNVDPLTTDFSNLRKLFLLLAYVTDTAPSHSARCAIQSENISCCVYIPSAHLQRALVHSIK